MLLTIHDANLKKVAFIDNDKQETLNYYDDTWTRSLETGSSTFEFTVYKKAIKSDTAINKTYNLLNERAFVSFRHNGKSYVFNVMTVEENEQTIKCYCENLNLELINEYANPYKATKAMSFVEYCNAMDLLNFTHLSVGINEISDQKRTLEWEGQDTKLARLLSLAKKFDAEIDFDTQLNADSSIKSFKVNIYHENDATHQGVGRVRNDIQLTYGKNLKSIKRKIDKTGVYNAIRPTGKRTVKNGKGEEVEEIVTIGSLGGWSENNKDGVREFYQQGDMLYAPLSMQMYPSAFTSSTTNDQWIRKDLEVDSDNPTVIRAAAIANLRKNAYPAITYDVDGFIDVEVGDTVKIYDDGFSPILLVQARVSDQKISFTNPNSNKTTFANFKALENNLSDGIQAAFERLFEASKPYLIKLSTDNGVIFKNQIGQSIVTPTLYKGGKPVVAGVTWRWALDGHTTTGMTYTVRGADVTETTTLTIAAYIGNDEVAVDEISFVNVLDGAMGTPGTPGRDGRTPYVHTAWANSATGTSGFSLDSSINKLYIGIYTDFEPNDSTDPTKYKWALIKGEKGDKGEQGERGLQGLQGAKGDQGVSYHLFTTNYRYGQADINRYVAVGYTGTWAVNEMTSTVKVGDAVQMAVYNTDKAGTIYVLATVTAVVNSRALTTVSKGMIDKGDKGDTGPRGPQGERGIAGATGATGSPGPKGADGRSSYIHIKYAPVINPTDSQITDTPNAYIGVYTDYNQADSTRASAYTWSKWQGKDGVNGVAGAKGADGRTTYVHFAYANSANGQTNFSTSYFDGALYMGTLTDYTQADSTNYAAYTWSRLKGEKGDKGDKGERGLQGLQGIQGPKGDQGIPGAKGADGRTQYTHIAYADTVSGSGFSQTNADKAYIGVYVDFNATDSTNPASYRWSRWRGADGQNGRDGAQGIPGKPGADGRTPYFHRAWANSADGRDGFSTSDSTNKRYLGTLTDFVEADSQDPAKYKWTALFDLVQVGGRNLFYKSQNVKQGGYYSHSGTWVADAVYSATSSGIILSSNDTYILQSWGKSGSWVGVAEFDSSDVFQRYTTLYLDKNGYISHTIKPKSDGYAYISYQNNDETLKIKLERGNLKTDYTIAPEDLQTDIDSKADQALTQEQLNALNEQAQLLDAELKAKASMEALSDLEKAYQSFVKTNAANQAKAEKELAEAGKRIDLLVTEFGGFKEMKTFIDTYMSSSNEGLIIGKNDASSTIKVSHDRISMFSAGREVMYISQGVIHIDNGIFTASVQIGRFRTEQYHLNPDMNVIRYIR
ncbi:TPA: phage tail spike protein [Streptococcus suis]